MNELLFKKGNLIKCDHAFSHFAPIYLILGSNFKLVNTYALLEGGPKIFEYYKILAGCYWKML